MSRIKLKNGGKVRQKAFAGADGAIAAAGSIAAAAITAAAQHAAAKKQADAIKEQANIQAESLQKQNDNNNKLQEESIAITKQENERNRDQQNQIQLALQMMTGQQNSNDVMEANKAQVKYGGRPKRRKLKQESPKGEDKGYFRVTDGGDMIPVATYPEGGVLYEAIGNDHKHYHKTSGGKYKSGVGLKFPNDRELEVEGNQNSNQGEYLYVNGNTNDALALSKHSIDGFNPSKAVNQGMHPLEVFDIQEAMKEAGGYEDDGSKLKKKSLKKTFGGQEMLSTNANLTQSPTNGTASVATALANVVGSTKSNVDDIQIAKLGTRIKLKNGGRAKAEWGDWAGSTYSSIGNLLGAGIGAIGNYYSGKVMSDAYNVAGETLANAYNNMKGIDMSAISREDFAAPHAMAAVRTANTNINPQLARLDRQAAAETKNINRGTLSSAARQQRLASVNDRRNQATNELHAYKNNADEQIKQANAARITQVAGENANRDAQATQAYASAKLNLMQYNNQIENAKIAGAAQARANALTESSSAISAANQSIANSFAGALNSSGNSFASAYNNKINQDWQEDILLSTADKSAVDEYNRRRAARKNK